MKLPHPGDFIQMNSYVSAAVRRLVAVRADFLCEYCLVHEDDTVFGCEVDHIISEKHDGQRTRRTSPTPVLLQSSQGQ
jgi:hypothetical protein